MILIERIFVLILTILIIMSCSEELIFEDRYPEKNYLEIKFCSYINDASVSDLEIDLEKLKEINDSYLEKESLTSLYLDPLFDTKTYNFIWFNIFKSKLQYVEYEINFEKKKKFINWLEGFQEKVFCNSEQKQVFYSIYENDVKLGLDEKFQKKVNFCKFLPNINLYDFKRYLDEDFNSSSQIKILLPEKLNDSFDLILEENYMKNLRNESDASQMGYLISCNENIPEEFLEGLNFDSYPIYISN